jgi:hypothetical protein
LQFGKHNGRRHSQRVCVSVDVVVFWRGAVGEPASEETKTLAVNAHGALVILRRAVQLGDSLNLKNATTADEIACRVVSLGSRDNSGTMPVGIEFVEPARRFWHIEFPPEDWSFHYPDAKTHGR